MPEIYLHLYEKLSIFLANFYKKAAKKKKATHPIALKYGVFNPVI
jgi:hypothetical protein